MYESRMGNFGVGATTNTGGPSEPASLQASAAKFNSANPRGFRANAMNQQYMLSPDNGNSQADAQRQTPTGQLPSPNGMSRSTYNKMVPNYGFSLGL